MDKGFWKINKKGEITTQQIVTLVILIASFAIILFFIFRLNPTQTTNEEICHNSVVLKGQSKLGTGSLDCKTSYLCISGGEDCKDIVPTETIKVDLLKGDQQVKDQILQIMADKMASCWWMFGEGKIDFGGGSFTDSCAICGIIKFDNNIIQKYPEINYLDLYSYLEKNAKGDETYLEYIYGVNSLDAFRKSSQRVKNFDFDSEKISTIEKYSIIFGVNTDAGKDNYVPPYIVKSSETTNKFYCEAFDLTKA